VTAEAVRGAGAAARATRRRRREAVPDTGLAQLRMPIRDHGMSGPSRQANDSGPMMIRMLAQVVPEVQVVEIATVPGQKIPGFASEPWAFPGLDKVRSRLHHRVLDSLLGQSTRHSFSTVIAGAPWRVLVEPIRTEVGEVVGALFVARQGRVWTSWERSLVKAFGAVLSQGAILATRERSLLQERRLDGLVG
jgi:hypothetical protein